MLQFSEFPWDNTISWSEPFRFPPCPEMDATYISDFGFVWVPKHKKWIETINEVL